MRTKTFLLAAAALAVGITASQAQVYSVNAVGYINVTCKQGYQIVANQLNTTNNAVPQLFPSVPNGTKVLKWVGTGFSINSFDVDFGWDDPTSRLSPGEGAFVLNPTSTPFTVTFVGEVPQGNLTNAVPHNYSLQSSQVPQAGLLQGNLGYVPSANDKVLKWINNGPSNQGYQISTYDVDFGWDLEPNLAVGEGFFINRSAAGNGQWTRAFSVN